MTKHTPGPWTIEDSCIGVYIRSAGVDAIAKVCINDRWYANAQLIAAAPEMYEALVGVTAYLADTITASNSPQTDGKVLTMLNNVLKKAEGKI